MISQFDREQILKSGGIGIMPTDTIYGLLGRALSKKAVSRIYKIKNRSPQKPFIILIADIKDLRLFKIKPDAAAVKFLKKIWPGKISVILACARKEFSYLHRGTKSLAFRLPKNKRLIKTIRTAGPLIAPSANPEGLPPARNIKEAENYFGDKVNFYAGAGNLRGAPSTLISIENTEKNGRIKILRQGADFKKIKNLWRFQ